MEAIKKKGKQVKCYKFQDVEDLSELSGILITISGQSRYLIRGNELPEIYKRKVMNEGFADSLILSEFDLLDVSFQK